MYEGVTLEDGVFCGPSMVFTNVKNPRSEIRRMHELRATSCAAARAWGKLHDRVRHDDGRYAFVGAGAVVVKDVPDYALVVGNPGRVLGLDVRLREPNRFAERQARARGGSQQEIHENRK